MHQNHNLKQKINQTCGFKSRCIRLFSRRICRPATVKYKTFQHQLLLNFLLGHTLLINWGYLKKSRVGQAKLNTYLVAAWIALQWLLGLFPGVVCKWKDHPLCSTQVQGVSSQEPIEATSGKNLVKKEKSHFPHKLVLGKFTPRF